MASQRRESSSFIAEIGCKKPSGFPARGSEPPAGDFAKSFAISAPFHNCGKRRKNNYFKKIGGTTSDRSERYPQHGSGPSLKCKPMCYISLLGVSPPLPRAVIYHKAKSVARKFWRAEEKFCNLLQRNELMAEAAGFASGGRKIDESIARGAGQNARRGNEI